MDIVEAAALWKFICMVLVLHFITGLKIREVQRVARVGLCGNGRCERGERCGLNGQSSTTDGACCSADCPYVPMGCAVTLQGPRKNLPCSGNGICLDTSGQCDCFDGYQGAACDLCLSGYTKLLDGQCIKVPSVTVLKNLSNIFFNTTVKATDGNVPPSKGSSGGGGSVVGTIVILIICGGILYICWKKYGLSITTSPVAEGALQALGLRTGSHPQDPGNSPETGAVQMQHESSWTEGSTDDSNRRARRSSLKEERREAVEERRKSRSYGPEHSSTRKSLMMTPDSFGSAGGGRPQSPPGFSPAPMNQQKQGGMMGESGVISTIRKSLTGEQNNYGKLDASDDKDEEPKNRNYPRVEEQNYRNYPRDEEAHYRNHPRDEEAHYKNHPRDEEPHYKNHPRDVESNYRAFRGDEEQGYKNYPSSSTNFFGGGPNTLSSTNFFGGGPTSPSNSDLL